MVRQQEASFPRFDADRHGSRSVDQGSALASVQLAVEGKADEPDAMPLHDRRTAKRTAVQDRGAPNRKIDRAIELRAAGGQVDDLDGMALTMRLQERRQGDRDARMDAAVRIGIAVLKGLNGAWHHFLLAAAA